MDVKSEFLNGYIQEEVNVEEPLGFESHNFLNHGFRFCIVLSKLLELGMKD